MARDRSDRDLAMVPPHFGTGNSRLQLHGGTNLRSVGTSPELDRCHQSASSSHVNRKPWNPLDVQHLGTPVTAEVILPIC